MAKFVHQGNLNGKVCPSRQGLLERRDRKLPKMGKIIGGLLTFFDLDGKLLEITAKFFQGIGG